jgi:hypothetical protein
MSFTFSPYLRPSKASDAIAKDFAAWCKKSFIITRGMVRVGVHPKSGRRGLIAAKFIPKDDTIVTVPVSAMLNFTHAMKDQTFTSIFAQANLAPLLTPQQINEKMHNSFIYRHHMVLAMYMVHMILSQDYQRHEFLPYVDFLPRGEGNFDRLFRLVHQLLEVEPECQSWMEALGKKHYIKAYEVRDMMLWCMAMIFSRSVPIEHPVTVAKMLEGTEYIDVLKKNYKQPVSSFCPIIDMCNHHPVENAAVMVPDHEMKHTRVIMLRSVQPIEAGEEVLLTYGGGKLEELELIYGIERAK